MNRKCRAGYFPCDHNRCFAESVRCDGSSNCRDGSDESDCPCPLEKFNCSEGENFSLRK